jgi:hypothetical protein
MEAMTRFGYFILLLYAFVGSDGTTTLPLAISEP